jgi:tetratricopeptide (TPR) repeat protein
LGGREKILGPEHPDTLTIVNNLANLLSIRGECKTAEALYRRALQGYEIILKTEHPSASNTVHNLGVLLRQKGDHEGLLQLYRRHMEARKKIFGPEHPKTLRSAYALGIRLNCFGRRAEALKLLRGFAELSEKARDYVAYNLACYECLEGNIEEAKRLIADYLKKHPDKKNQALEDDDFTAIHDWISQL